MTLSQQIKKIIPWLSLSWGIFSAFLISHNVWGIHKVVLFAGCFAAAGLLGALLPHSRHKAIAWIELVSQQSAAQYIFFFAAPLLWKSENWKWLTLVSVIAGSTLWDPLFNKFWESYWYRLILVTTALLLVVGLISVTWQPALMTSSTLVLISTSLLSHVCVSLSRQRPNNSSPSAQREQVNPLRILLSESWKGIAVAAVLLIAARPLPPLGVWLVEGKILADSENKSIECLTRIAAPAGFKSEIKHEWTFKNSSRVIDQVTLPEILGNGIDEKPFTTRSRKKAFPIPFAEVVTKEIECSVVLPGGGRIGRVSGLPQSETAIKMP